MPVGYPSNPGANPDDESEGQLLTLLGQNADLIELGSDFLINPLVPVVAGFADLGITGFACIKFHQCYYGQPHPDLPNMLVINQDVIVTTGDAFAPVGAALIGALPTGGLGAVQASIGTDIVTSGGSYLYDIGRLTGNIPNIVSVGTDFSTMETYILIYQ
jgi:hypothetical protein